MFIDNASFKNKKFLLFPPSIFWLNCFHSYSGQSEHILLRANCYAVARCYWRKKSIVQLITLTMGLTSDFRNINWQIKGQLALELWMFSKVKVSSSIIGRYWKIYWKIIGRFLPWINYRNCELFCARNAKVRKAIINKQASTITDSTWMFPGWSLHLTDLLLHGPGFSKFKLKMKKKRLIIFPTEDCQWHKC